METNKEIKGIILAAGAGTRLYPASLTLSKTLLPVYDKPMIYYPLSTLMLAGVRNILIITSPEDQWFFKKLLGDGSKFGVKIQYDIQYVKRGIADAFIIGEKFVNKKNVILILADNIFYGQNFEAQLKKTLKNNAKENFGATVFGYKVNDPERFGIAEFDNNGRVISLEEKPKNPKSQYAVTGLYFYADEDVCKFAKELKPSARGELEITDLNKVYLDQGKLNLEILDNGFIWFDTGTHESVLAASNKIKELENQNKEKIGCLEEIAYKRGFISSKNILKNVEKYKNNSYYDYVRDVIEKE